MQDVGECDVCKWGFNYSLIHCGFSDAAFAYCDTCGFTALLSLWSAPGGLKLEYGAISPDIQALLKSCPCGGSFGGDAGPRCPHCKAVLSASAATIWIEGNAPGAAKGWRWQRSWKGLYALIVEDRRVDDPWIATK
jgi:hypothetical protein